MSDASRILKLQTRDEHDRTERTLAIQRLLAKDLSRLEFAGIQSRFLGVFEPLERSVGIGELWSPSGITPSPRSPALKADLQNLGVCLESVPRAEIAETGDLAESLGRVYVLEGSRIGGQVIQKSLKLNGWFQNDAYGQFFENGESDRWARILRWLDGSLDDEKTLASAVRGAKEAFTQVEKWMTHDK